MISKIFVKRFPLWQHLILSINFMQAVLAAKDKDVDILNFIIKILWKSISIMERDCPSEGFQALW